VTVLPHDLEALESVSQDETACELFLRMARLARAGELNRFLFELDANEDLDAETKAAVAEVARDRTFLSALDEYVHRTRTLH